MFTVFKCLHEGLGIDLLFFSDAFYLLISWCRPPRERKIRDLIPACAVRFFSGSSHTSDLNTDIPVATLPGAWRYWISAGTGWPGVSIL